MTQDTFSKRRTLEMKTIYINDVGYELVTKNSRRKNQGRNYACKL